MSTELTRLPEKIYRFIYSRVPRLCVDIVIRDRQGRILLSRRDIPPDQGQWHFPGGRVYHQERLNTAVKRICREETGLRVKIERLIGAIEYRHLGGWGHTVSLAFLTRPMGGRLRGSFQAREVVFFKALPPHTEAEVRQFLTANKLLKSRSRHS